MTVRCYKSLPYPISASQQLLRYFQPENGDESCRKLSALQGKLCVDIKMSHYQNHHGAMVKRIIFVLWSCCLHSHHWNLQDRSQQDVDFMCLDTGCLHQEFRPQWSQILRLPCLKMGSLLKAYESQLPNALTPTAGCNPSNQSNFVDFLSTRLLYPNRISFKTWLFIWSFEENQICLRSLFFPGCNLRTPTSFVATSPNDLQLFVHL